MQRYPQPGLQLGPRGTMKKKGRTEILQTSLLSHHAKDKPQRHKNQLTTDCSTASTTYIGQRLSCGMQAGREIP